LTDELEARVAEQRAGQQTRLAGDLKAVADRENRPPAFRKRDDVLHHRAEARDGAGSQVITVAEPSREEEHVALFEVVIPLPQMHGVFAQLLDDCLVGVVITIRPGERDDPELHVASTVAISKSSVTGLARSLAHMSRVDASAAARSPASSSTTIC